jgi:hypothetical protein
MEQVIKVLLNKVQSNLLDPTLVEIFTRLFCLEIWTFVLEGRIPLFGVTLRNLP